MPYRVIQWATGVVGRYALRSILNRPDLELVGVVVHDPAKAGRDAGELAGVPPTGVRATADPEEAFALDADCVSYMPAPSAFFADDPDRDTEVLCRLLAAGKNVVTTTGYLYPAAHGAALVAQLEAACREGGTSLHGTGLNPGFMGDLVPLVLSGLSARLDRVFARESSDMTGYASPGVIVDLMGFTKPPERYEVDAVPYRRFMLSCFAESIHLVAAGLGLTVEEVRAFDEYELATRRLEIAAGVAEPGTVCGSRWAYTGVVDGRDLVTLEVVYKVHPDVVTRWCPPGFAVRIEGRPRLDLEVGGEWIQNGLLATAAHAVNAIPLVCEAPPGVRTLLDLPLVTARGVVSGV